jgi:asparagine synthase (glutamine-hydrolysing)
MGAGYGLGHRRLAIVDVAQGQQPMSDERGRVWVTFNGEIYNFQSLRTELVAAGYRFETNCDTEVLVHGYREWGVDLPRRLRGMFVFGIVDEVEHTFFAARDRMGQKPVYYAVADDNLWFGSELKAILAGGHVSRTICPQALGQFLCLGYVPDPLSIFSEIKKLPPASYLTVKNGHVDVREYWSPEFNPGETNGSSPPLADQEAEFRHLLDEAVEGRLMGEVPLGAFLSGGVDSFAVVDSMRRVNSGEVLACTVGFDDPEYDEREFARASANACNARLFEEVVTVADMLDLDWFADVYDEPFSDSSAIPTYHVSRMARRHVTVALSGDGGDEGFAGYRRYRFDARENAVRDLLPNGAWSRLGAAYPKLDFLPRWLRFKRTFQNLATSPEDAYARSVSRALPEETQPLLRPGWRSDDPLAPVRDAYLEADGCHPIQRCAHADRRTWLPGDILTKVDRASMAVSLEVRSPFLDHPIIEFGAALPHDRKMLGGESKGFLRDALRGRLGNEALDRQKRGFSVPLAQWLRGPLGDALQTTLRDGPLEQYLDITPVEAMLDRHRRGARDFSQNLWSMFVLDGFLRRWAP